MKSKAGIFGIGIVVGVLILPGCVNREAQGQAKRTEEILGDRTPVVTVQSPKIQTVAENLTITGQITSSDDTTVGAKIGGRIVAVYVKDGDLVSPGQVIAQQETSNQMSQLRQAQAGLQAAQSALSQAISQKASRPKQSISAIRAAQAQLDAARGQLAKAKRGARKEQLRQAEIQVDAAKANLDTSKKELDRQRNLYNEGATSRQRYEQAENAYSQALAGYEAALEGLRLQQNLYEPEDISSLESQVRQAEANLSNAKANKELDVTWDQQIASARANVEAARATVELAQQAIADATIRSPFSGRVSGKPIQPGTVVGPGTPVVRLLGADGLYFEGNVPETAIDSVLIGSPVEVTLSAFAGRTFAGRVAAINPQADELGRLFKARIVFEESITELKAGMFAKGQIQMREVAGAVMVPPTAIVQDSDKSYVFVLRGDKSEKVEVKRGIASGDWVQVIGINEQDRVVIRGQSGLKGGEKVRLDEGKAKTEPAGDSKEG